MISALLALLASASFGASDFIAAITSRRISPVAVALWSQLAGAAALLVALTLSGQRPEVSGIAWGAGSGVVVPVGVFGGELPSAVVVVGLLAAVGGLAIVSLVNSEDPMGVTQPCPGRKPLLERNVPTRAAGLGNPRRV